MVRNEVPSGDDGQGVWVFSAGEVRPAGGDGSLRLAGGERRERAARRLVTTGTNPALDRLAELAARLLGAPAAQVSLLSDVQTITAAAGLDPGAVGSTSPLAESLCTVTATSGLPLVVEDAAADERVSALPPVASGAVGAYLGVPLTGQDGHIVGALCVFGPAPRLWTQTDVSLLADLAAAAVSELELSALAVEYEASRLRWQLAIAAGGIGSFDWDVASGSLAWDERLLEMFGYDGESFSGTLDDFTARVHPDDVSRVTELLEEAVATGGGYDAEYRIRLPDGAVRWVHARGRALCGQDGTTVRVVGAAYDTTATRETDARLARVLETMSVAFCSFDTDWRFTYVNTEAERLIGRRREELLGGLLWELFPDTVGSDLEAHYRAAVASGEPVTFDTYRPAPFDAWYEVRAWPGPEGLSVYFVDVTARRAVQEQADAAREAAEAAAARAEAAQEAAELNAHRLQLLATISAELSATLDIEEAVARLARLVVPELAQWCIVSLADGTGDLGRGLRDIGWWHADARLRGLVERYGPLRLPSLDPGAPAKRSITTGRAVVVAHDATRVIGASLRSEEAKHLLRSLAPESAVFLPLQAGGRTLGLLSLFSDDPARHTSAAVLDTASEVAARAGLALDNARLYTQQQRMAEGLQRSLLTAPVEPDHCQIVVRYQPAAEAAQVGGDWYDAFLQPDGATVLVIGDVMGHDIAAAAGMGQVRSLLRGIAYATGGSPAAVLSSLDATMQGLAVETTASAVVARLEQDDEDLRRGVNRLCWSNAGHPPPLLLTPDGEVVALGEGQPDLLLGIDPALPRRDGEREIGRGSTVLLYTDGLVERRGQTLDEGLQRLREAVADLAEAPLDDLCDGVLARLLPERPEDDVALVAVRLHPQDRPRPPEAGPNRVPPTPRP